MMGKIIDLAKSVCVQSTKGDLGLGALDQS